MVRRLVDAVDKRRSLARAAASRAMALGATEVVRALAGPHVRTPRRGCLALQRIRAAAAGRDADRERRRDQWSAGVTPLNTASKRAFLSMLCKVLNLQS